MVAQILDGKVVAKLLTDDVAHLIHQFSARPGLTVVLVGDDPASHVYVGAKQKKCEELGMSGTILQLPSHISEQELCAHLLQLNQDPNVHGILVQLPLPSHINTSRVLSVISPVKDVDGIHPENLGRLVTGDGILTPCTPQGCVRILNHYKISVPGKNIVVMGRSRIVGMPITLMLTHLNGTVTLAHSHTANVQDLCQTADILVTAVGQPQLVKGDWLKPDVVVIDVGINRLSDPATPSLVGDVDVASVTPVASALTPVPGGVGPMTIACLMRNTLVAWGLQNNVVFPEGIL